MNGPGQKVPIIPDCCLRKNKEDNINHFFAFLILSLTETDFLRHMHQKQQQTGADPGFGQGGGPGSEAESC